MKLLTYFGISTLLALASIYHSYSIHEQFYPTIVYLTNNKLCILSLGNFGFCFVLSIASIIIKIFFTEMGDDETNEIMLRAKYSITEICIILTSFRNELSKTVVMMFVVLLFIKAFHWLSVLRMENFQRGLLNNNNNNNNDDQAQPPRHRRLRLCHCLCNPSFRLFIGLTFLLFLDIISSSILIYLLYISQKFSVIVLFIFEFTILSCSIFTQISKFIVLLIDKSYNETWSYKPIIMFIFEFLHDLAHLGLYCIFIWILTTNWGFPLHLLRELFLAFHTLRNRIIHFYNYRKIMRVLDTQFNTITRDQLNQQQRDIICVICFAEMDNGKELPCKHVFHLNCLKRWFEQKQECPMCRLKIIPNQQQQQQQQQPQQQPPPPQDDNKQDDNDDNKQNDIYPSYSYQYPYHQYYTSSNEINQNQIQNQNQNQKQQFNYDPYHQYYNNYYYNYHQQYELYKNNPNYDLEQLSKRTKREIEYHEMCVIQLKQSLENYSSLQSKWRKEDIDKENE